MPSEDLIQHVKVNLEALVSHTEWISKVMKEEKARCRVADYWESDFFSEESPDDSPEEDEESLSAAIFL